MKRQWFLQKELKIVGLYAIDLPIQRKDVFVLCKRIAGSDARYITDLFDDGKPQPITAGILRDFIKTLVQTSRIQWFGMSCITDNKLIAIQYDIDGTAWDIMVAGIAKQVVQQYIYQLRVGSDSGFPDPGPDPDPPALP